MISPTLTSMETGLRRAAGRRNYGDVQRMVVSVSAAAGEQVRHLPAGDPQIREIAAWLDELLEWTGIMLRIGRAAHADELRRIPFLKRYLRQQVRAASQMRLDL